MSSESSDSIKTKLDKFLTNVRFDIEIDSPAPVAAPLPPPPQAQQQWQQPAGGFALLSKHAPHAVSLGGSSAMNRSYIEVPTPFRFPATGANAQMSGLKRVHDGGSDSSTEKKKRRMIKNRESAARSRAKKEAYNANLEAEVKSLRTENEILKKSKTYNAILEAEVKSLRAENEILKKSKENLVRLSNTPPPPEPKRKLQRAASTHF